MINFRGCLKSETASFFCIIQCMFFGEKQPLSAKNNRTPTDNGYFQRKTTVIQRWMIVPC